MYKPEYFFNNDFRDKKENIFIINNDDKYTKNFGKQWEKYRDIQIDSLNNFEVSKKYLEELLFNNLSDLKDKKILEIGCGSGRFTEYLAKYAKICVSIDLSSAIYHNVAKKNNNVILIKSDLHDLKSKNKFDIVICRGVLQHTPNPDSSILKLYDFIDIDGNVYFDIYPIPKIGKMHPKYLIWRPLLKSIYTFEQFEKILINKIDFLLKIKRFIKKIFFNSDFISDLFIPVWDYKDKINISDEQLKKFSILDTLYGIFPKYDNPKSNKQIVKLLNKNNIKIINNLKKRNYFKTKLN